MSFRTLIQGFAQQQIAVIGDVILDEYLIGTATRMSREAPIPVLELTERRFIAGGAANPSANITALGARAVQISVIGQDAAGDQLRAALVAQAIDDSGLIVMSGRATPVKTRIMAQMGLRFPQQVARIDTLPASDPDTDTRHALTQQVQHAVTQVGALLFSDYRGGVLNQAWIQHLRHHTSAVLLTADTQGNLAHYDGFNLVKCNAADMQTILGRLLTDESDYEQALRGLAADLHLEALVVTRGPDGASLYSDGQYARLAAPEIRDVFDTVGAGDTFIAVATLARLAGAGWTQAVQLANIASGIVIQHVGNYTPTQTELMAALS